MANVDGIISLAEEAKISVLDRGFLYGDSIYEVFRTYEGVPYLYEEHADRFENSARLAQMNISQTREQIRKEIEKTIQASGVQSGEDVYVRYTITRGSGPIDLDPNRSPSTSFIILVKPVPEWPKENYADGVKLAIPNIRRNSSQTLEPNIKGGNYLNNVLAVGEAKAMGADDALMLNLNEKLTECSNSNILFVIDGAVVTPAVASGNLDGTSKRIVARVCEQFSIGYAEREMSVSDISSATECFITSATREVMPVRSVLIPDGKRVEFPSGGGELTKRLQQMYKDYIKKYVDDHNAEAFF